MSSKEGSQDQDDLGNLQVFTIDVDRSFDDTRTKGAESNDAMLRRPIEMESAKYLVEALGSIRAKALDFICRLQHCGKNE